MEMCDLPFTCNTNDPEQTLGVAARFAQLSQPGDLILLSGPLGAGKTHFVRGFCRGLGMADLWEVDSPTYTIVNHYDVASGVDHLDLYRFQDAADLEEIDFEDMLASDSILLVEWPERLDGYPIPMPRFVVSFEVGDESSRTIRITAPQEEAVS